MSLTIHKNNVFFDFLVFISFIKKYKLGYIIGQNYLRFQNLRLSSTTVQINQFICFAKNQKSLI